MVAAHRGRLECARALLRAGADPNFVNTAGGLVRGRTHRGGHGVHRLLLLAHVGWGMTARSGTAIESRPTCNPSIHASLQSPPVTFNLAPSDNRYAGKDQR